MFYTRFFSLFLKIIFYFRPRSESVDGQAIALTPLEFHFSEVEGFRYRVENALRYVSGVCHCGCLCYINVRETYVCVKNSF